MLLAHVLHLDRQKAAVGEGLLQDFAWMVGVDMYLDDLIVVHQHQAVPQSIEEGPQCLGIFLGVPGTDELCTVAELDLSRLKAPKVRLLPLGDGRGLLVVGRGRDSVEFVQHSLEDHHKAHAAGVHHPGLFQHRVLVHRVRQGLPGPLKGRSQHILKGGVFLRRPAGPVPRQTGDGEHRPLRRLHHRLIGRDHPRVQRVGQVNAVHGVLVLHRPGESPEDQGENHP